MAILHPLRPSSPCPCSSGKPYRDCCQPAHKGSLEPERPADVVRARYSAYAIGDVDFLWRTLHPKHEDRALPEDLARRSLEETSKAFKYPGLTIFSEKVDGASAVVTFRAKVFERGRDLSFEEASRFELTGHGWRYLSGDVQHPGKSGR